MYSISCPSLMLFASALAIRKLLVALVSVELVESRLLLLTRARLPPTQTDRQTRSTVFFLYSLLLLPIYPL